LTVNSLEWQGSTSHMGYKMSLVRSSGERHDPEAGAARGGVLSACTLKYALKECDLEKPSF